MVVRRGFQVAALLAFLGAAASVAFAVATLAIGVGALTGALAYPYEVSIGPAHVSARMELPVVSTGPVCQSASVADQPDIDCYRFFVHESVTSGEALERRQDADIRPADATLRGVVNLATNPGWSPYVAATVVNAAVTALLLAGIFFLVARLMWAAAAGEVFTAHTVRRLRGIAALVVVSALLAPVSAVVRRLDVLGYWAESFGLAPGLLPDGDIDFSLPLLGLGFLLLLVAEVFHHGVALEDEARMTV